jgi:hypothetical protein
MSNRKQDYDRNEEIDLASQCSSITTHIFIWFLSVQNIESAVFVFDLYVTNKKLYSVIKEDKLVEIFHRNKLVL